MGTMFGALTDECVLNIHSSALPPRIWINPAQYVLSGSAMAHYWPTLMGAGKPGREIWLGNLLHPRSEP